MSDPITVEEGTRFAVPFRAEPRPRVDEGRFAEWDLRLPDDASLSRLDVASDVEIPPRSAGTMVLEVAGVGHSKTSRIRYLHAVVVDARVREEFDDEDSEGEQTGLGYRSNLHYTGNDLAGPTSTAHRSNSDRPI